MSMYRVKSGLHFINGQLLRIGETFALKNDKFIDAENAKLFEKIEEPKAPKKAKEPESPIGPVGQSGELGPDDTGVGDEPGTEGEPGEIGQPLPALPGEQPKKRGPKPKNPAE